MTGMIFFRKEMLFGQSTCCDSQGSLFRQEDEALIGHNLRTILMTSFYKSALGPK